MARASGEWSASRLAIGLAAVLAIVATGCGADPGFPPLGNGGSSGAGNPTASNGSGDPGGACSPELSKKACRVTLDTHNGITNCFEGFQMCLGGHWSLCTDGKVTHRVKVPKAEVEEIPVGATLADLASDSYPKALNATVASCNDPCDPTCTQITDTTPPGGTVMAMSGGGSWTAAPGNTVPGLCSTTASKGCKQPCGAGWDCQFDEYCSNPVTKTVAAGQCSHDKCGVGVALDASVCTDACVQAVCKQDGHCCTQCAHSPCAVGAGLGAACQSQDTCVQTVCGVSPACCSGAWDLTCVVGYAACRVLTQSTFVCPAGQTSGWDSTCVQEVHDVCDVTCVNTTAGCTHDKCVSGQALVDNCDGAPSCVHAVCTTPGLAYCCTAGMAWDAACIAAIPSACGSVCPTAAQTGVCSRWVPNQVDALCTGPDLTVGVACTNSATAMQYPGQQVVPVCNVGTQPTPMGSTLVVNKYTKNTSNIPGNPPTGTPNGAACTLAAQVLPGKCVDVPCTTAIGDELFVNPAGANHITECSSVNNWSMNLDTAGNPIGCDAPSCSPPNNLIWTRPPHLFLAVDRSSAVPPAVFTNIKSGLNLYFSDATEWTKQASIAGGSFPQTGCDPATCGGTTCTTGQALAAFTAATPFTTWASGLTQAAGLAPYSTALNNAITAAIADYNGTGGGPWAKPFPIVVLVLGSDPTVNNSCTWNPTALAGIAASAYANNGVRTFVIAAGGALPSTAQTIAAAGHGKAYPPWPNPPNSMTLPNQIHDALVDIRTSSYPCSVNLPPLALFDPSSAVVSTFNLASVTTTIPQVTDYTACAGGGFYYDNNAAPTQMILCPTTCSTLAGDFTPSTNVIYKVGCPGFYPTSTTMPTVYPGTCPSGTQVQWRYLSYDTVLPSMTTVQFFVQTPSMAMSKPAAWAGMGNPATCQSGGPAGCPIDLVTLLDGTNPNGPAFGATMALSATLNPNPNKTNSPTINSWQLKYSCPFVE